MLGLPFKIHHCEVMQNDDSASRPYSSPYSGILLSGQRFSDLRSDSISCCRLYTIFRCCNCCQFPFLCGLEKRTFVENGECDRNQQHHCALFLAARKAIHSTTCLCVRHEWKFFGSVCYVSRTQWSLWYQTTLASLLYFDSPASRSHSKIICNNNDKGRLPQTGVEFKRNTYGSPLVS